MLNKTNLNAIGNAVSGLDAWFDTMRGPGGYGGPVVHWWQQSLIYTGPGLDWRYEGIITGYLHLWERTGNRIWLTKACRAGGDLLSGQLENGHYPASAFELNPATAGTPHEAACDIGLLLLALSLRKAGSADWQPYAASAERNLHTFYIDQLWDIESQSFRDHPKFPWFVPNKAATACEAMFLLAELTGNDRWVEQYALPTLRRIIEYQIQDKGRLEGAIAQNSFGARQVDKYFPIYNARCVPALLRGYQWTRDELFVQSAIRTMQFITRWGYADGSFPTVVYANQRVNRYPSWVAPLGDILYAADQLRPYGSETDLSATEHRLLAGQDASGGIRTSTGFAAATQGRQGPVPDLRDVIHVAGWCDKAFRYLTSCISAMVVSGQSSGFELDCTFRGQQMCLVETPEMLMMDNQQGVCYRWLKGEPWPQIATAEFWLH